MIQKALTWLLSCFVRIEDPDLVPTCRRRGGKWQRVRMYELKPGDVIRFAGDGVIPGLWSVVSEPRRTDAGRYWCWSVDGVQIEDPSS